MAKDYYKVLGIDKSATPEQIKKAFRELAHKHHPDKSGGDEQKFKEINEAYQVLSNQEKRQQYDQYGQTFDQARAQGGFGGAGGAGDFSDFASAFRNGNNGAAFDGDLGDIFGDLFGFGSRTKTRRRQSAAAELQASLTLNFTEAVFGVEKTITLEKDVACEHCHGSGAEPGSKISNCPTCGGRGQVNQSLGFGLAFATVCPTCNGSGQRAEKHCSRCRGRGLTKNAVTLTVKIPAGIDDGQTIRLSGQGQAVAGKQAGDLLLRINITPSPEFQRQGFDIITEQEISFSQAALGGKIEVKTVSGLVHLKIPEGTQSDKVFQLRGYGVPHLNGRGRGDQLVKIVVKTPTRLSRRQKQLLEELENSAE